MDYTPLWDTPKELGMLLSGLRDSSQGRPIKKYGKEIGKFKLWHTDSVGIILLQGFFLAPSRER